MEQKKQWNMRVSPSVAKAFDALAKNQYRGNKGIAATAACLMFLHASPAERGRYIDALSVAENRGDFGTVLEAAQKLLDAEVPTDEAAAARRDEGKQIVDRGDAKSRQSSRKSRRRGAG